MIEAGPWQESLFRRPKGQEDIGSALDKEALNVQISIPFETRVLAAKAHLTEMLENVVISFRYCLAYPQAFYDTLNMFLLNKGVQKLPDISYDLAYSLQVHTFRNTYQYCLWRRIGYTDDEALTHIHERVIANICGVGKYQELHEANSPVIIITQADTQDREHLAKILNAAVLNGKVIVTAQTESLEKTEFIQKIVEETLLSLGYNADSTMRARAEDLTPYTCIDTYMKLQESLGFKQATFYDAWIQAGFEHARTAMRELTRIFRATKRSHQLSEGEKLMFVVSILTDVVRAPSSIVEQFLSLTEEVRQNGPGNIDLTPLVEMITRTQQALQSISPTTARMYADMTAEAIGTTPENVFAIKRFLESQDVSLYASATGMQRIGEPILEHIGGIAARILGIPEPAIQPLKFCLYVENILRTAVWVNFFAVLHAIPIWLLTGRTFWESWYITRTYTWLQMLINIIPHLRILSVDKKTFQEGIVVKILPFGLASSLQKFADKWPELFGLGLGPMQVTRTEDVPGYMLSLQETPGTQTFQSTGAHHLWFRNDQSKHYVNAPFGNYVTDSRGFLVPSSDTLFVSHMPKKIGSDVADQAYIPLIGNWGRGIADRLNAIIGPHSWPQYPWRLTMHGVWAQRAHTIPLAEQWRLGKLRIKAFIWPIINIMKSSEEEGVITSGPQGGQLQSYASVDRVKLGYHFFGMLVEYWNSLMGGLFFYSFLDYTGLRHIFENALRAIDVRQLSPDLDIIGIPVREGLRFLGGFIYRPFDSLTSPEIYALRKELTLLVSSTIGKGVDFVRGRIGASGFLQDDPSGLVSRGGEFIDIGPTIRLPVRVTDPGPHDFQELMVLQRNQSVPIFNITGPDSTGMITYTLTPGTKIADIGKTLRVMLRDGSVYTTTHLN